MSFNAVKAYLRHNSINARNLTILDILIPVSTRIKQVNYVQVIDSLEALDVVKTNNKYSANRFSKSYSLSNSAVRKGIIEVEIFTQRFQNKLSKILLSEFQETVKDEVLNSVCAK